MAKSFKKFREEYEDEWGDDNESRQSERKKMKIRDQRRKKAKEKSARFEENEQD